MTEITQVRALAFPEYRNNTRGFSGKGMKTFVAGCAIKFTMMITKATAVSKITLSNPMMTRAVDCVDMTYEADYVYSYVYQTPSEDVYTGKWIITYQVTDSSDGITMLTQDKFTLTTQVL